MYTAKIGFKTYKCKGHTIIKENGCTMLILENEERVFIPSNKIIHFSRGWYEMEVENIKKQTGGQVNI